jgi:hypothetical protein
MGLGLAEAEAEWLIFFQDILMHVVLASMAINFRGGPRKL